MRSGRAKRFAALFNDPQLAIALTDRNAEVIQANEAFSSMFGIDGDSDAGSLLGAAHPEHAAEAEADLERLRSGELAQSKVERRFRRSDGAEFWADVTTTAVPDANGVPAYWQNVLVDTTSRRHAEELQRMRLAVIQGATEATTEPELVSRVVATLGSEPVWDETEIWLAQPDSGPLVLADSWSRNGAGSTGKRRNATARVSDGALARTAASQGAVATRVLGARQGRFATSRADGGLEVAVPASTDVAVVGVLVLRSATLRDLDEDIRATLIDLAARFGELLARRRAEQASRAATARLQELSTMDPLTGLQNRRAFDDRLNGAHPGRYAVLAIDLDNLKDINDAHGHEAGDHALRAAASVLASAVRGEDLLARVGGDEFGVLLEGAGIDEAVAVAERMRLSARAVSLPSGLLAMSVGCAAAEPNDSPRALWSAADAALYEAKRGGKDRIACASDTAARTTRQGADKVVMHLLTNRSVVSVYQPIVELSTRAVVGHEALARPRGAAPGTSVEAIFAAAHRLGVDRDLDWLCRRAAVRCARDLPAGTPIFVNVSIPALLDPVHGVDQMLLLLRSAGRSPEETVIEITERDAVLDVPRFREVLSAYRAEGFRFALDDVGQGHSTFEVLAASTPEFIKISANFSKVGVYPGEHSATRAAVAFARDTGGTVIAEGLETEERVALAAELGVTLGQGWALGRPAPASTWVPAAVPERAASS